MYSREITAQQIFVSNIGYLLNRTESVVGRKSTTDLVQPEQLLRVSSARAEKMWNKQDKRLSLTWDIQDEEVQLFHCASKIFLIALRFYSKEKLSECPALNKIEKEKLVATFGLVLSLESSYLTQRFYRPFVLLAIKKWGYCECESGGIIDQIKQASQAQIKS